MLHAIALSLKLEDHLRLARGESANESRKNLAALSDAMEGVIGALYLDAGFDLATSFIKTYWKPWIGTDLEPLIPKQLCKNMRKAKGRRCPNIRLLNIQGLHMRPSLKFR